MPESEISPPIAPSLDGWEPRFIGTEPRLTEVIDMYQEIGFDVLVRPFDAGSCQGCCTECFGGPQDRTQVVYTRTTQP